MSTLAQPQKERNLTVDIVKGIGVVLMVVRHARAPHSDFVSLFHMAIFFIASGFLYNRKYANDAKSLSRYIGRKLRSLYIPYLAYQTVFILLNNLFLFLNIYTDNPAFLTADVKEGYAVLGKHLTAIDMVKQIGNAALFQQLTQVGVALWFAQCLLFVLVGYTVVEYLAHRMTSNLKTQQIIQTVVSIGLLLLGYHCDLHGIAAGGLGRACSVYILIHIGVSLKDYEVMEKLKARNLLWVMGLVSGIVLCLGYHRGYISIANDDIENPVYFTVMSLAGWFLLYGIAVWLEKIGLNRLNRGLAYISLHSVPIIALHFLCFKLINVLAVMSYGMNDYMIAAFPVLMRGSLWWVLYTVAGIGLPLLLQRMYVKIGIAERIARLRGR